MEQGKETLENLLHAIGLDTTTKNVCNIKNVALWISTQQTPTNTIPKGKVYFKLEQHALNSTS